MAHLLAKLGKEALRPQLVNGTWRKAAISAKNVARLRKETLLAGGEWNFDEPPKEVKYRKPKGHKHDREKPQREAKIAANLETMESKITASRDKRREINSSLMDKLLLTPKQQRMKEKGG